MSRTVSLTLEDKSNRNVLTFNRDSVPFMRSICQPLFDTCGVTMFTFCRSFSNGKRFYWSSHVGWVEHYIHHNLKNDIEHLNYYLPPEAMTAALWCGFKKDSVFSAFYDFNLWHGFTIYEKSELYTDLFAFAASRDNPQITQFYLNNISFLKEFVNSFKQNALGIVEISENNQLIIPQQALLSLKNSNSILADSTAIENFIQRTTIPTYII